MSQAQSPDQSNVDRWLLPEGIEEILPPDAAKLESVKRKLLDLYISWGYRQVFPPLAEYLESLLTGVGNDLSLQTFKLTDQLNGRMMGLRADMTPQVARIDARYCQNEADLSAANRLCYVGEVLKTKPESLLDGRNPMQIGIELFGCSNVAADIEVATLMLTSLATCGLEAVHLDLGHVAIYRALSSAAQLDPSADKALRDIFQRKAVPELQEFVASHVDNEELKQAFLALATLSGDRKVLHEACDYLANYPEAIDAIHDLEVIADQMSARFPQVSLYFDLGELRGYNYHTGVVFSAYTQGHGQAIANGGRYDYVGEVFGVARAATGFSIDLVPLLPYMQKPYARPVIVAPLLSSVGAEEQESLADEIARLRDLGRVVVMALPGVDNPDASEQLVFNNDQWQVEAL